MGAIPNGHDAISTASGLHSVLQHDFDQAQPAQPPPPRPQDGEVVVADLPFSSLQLPASLVNYLELTQSQVGMIQVLMGSERQRLQPVLVRLTRNRQLLATATQNGKFDEKQIRKLAAASRACWQS